MQNLRLAAALALCAGALSCKTAGSRPTSLRELPPTDIDRCYAQAKSQGSAKLVGELNLYMIVDEQGNVPAAFVHDQQGLDYAPFQRCLADMATVAVFTSEKTDYLRPQGIRCAEGSIHCQKLPLKEGQPPPLDEKVARDTLAIADWSGPTDRGWAHYYVKGYSDAVAAFNEALRAKPEDVRALRGLAVALADSGGDLKQAREAAEKAVKAAPETEGAHEALLRACIAAKDDRCMFDEFEVARKAPDMRSRSFELALVQDAVKAAAERLSASAERERAEAEQKQREAEAAQDPTGCRKLAMGSDEQLVCFLKRCFDQGAKAYAKELKSLTGQNYAAGTWKVSNKKGSESDVTVQIRVAGARGKEPPPPHDATWRVSLGETIHMVARDPDSANIARNYDACKKR